MKTREAQANDIPALVPLLDAYRVFYRQQSNPRAAKEFLQSRFEHRDSIIFIAVSGEAVLGFTQLYPSFSTVGLARIYILNDLFVKPDQRGKGIGERLLRAAQEFCRSGGAKGLALETAADNPAQSLYERLGWKKDDGYFHYFWTAPTPLKE
jgi:ribosomal protein S18 acetylase RimI-like enzyme